MSRREARPQARVLGSSACAACLVLDVAEATRRREPRRVPEGEALEAHAHHRPAAPLAAAAPRAAAATAAPRHHQPL